MTREQLYNLVWTKPVSKILVEYSITQTGFKNLCNENDVPLPHNGYWQKLRHNKKVVQTPLPVTDKSYTDINLPKRVVGEESLNSLSELNLLTRDIKNNKNLPIEVPQKLIKPDKIIRTTRDYFKRKKQAKHNDKVEFPKEGIFSIQVSDGLKRRSLIFANTLIKLFRKRGHDVKVFTNQEYYNHNGTKIIVFGEYFGIRIRESNLRVMEKHPKYDWKEAKYYPSGKLSLKIDNFHSYEWSDSKIKKLETKLPNILAYLELRAKRKKQKRIESEIWHREYERKKKIEEEFKERREKELNAFKAVISNSSRWQKAMDLRNYIKVVEKDAIENNKLNEELKTWLKWIKDKADWYDPLIEKEDELFKEVDRDTLTAPKRYW